MDNEVESCVGLNPVGILSSVTCCAGDVSDEMDHVADAAQIERPV